MNSRLEQAALLIFTTGLLFSACQNNKQPETVEEEVAGDSLTTSYYLDIITDSLETEEFQIKSGDNLGSILNRFNVSPGKVDSLRLKAKGIFDITKLQTGRKYKLLTDLQNGFAQYMVYEKSARDHVVFDLRDSMRVYEYSKEVSIRPENASGEIRTSLWNAIRHGGHDLALSDKMAEIYAWQIDFFGIAKGDNFRLLYDQAYIDDSTKMEVRDIRGALFNHHGKDYYAIPFMQDSIVEYFDENGESLRKAFLKAPLKFSRISSTFSHARRHPVLKIVRPHHGVDYAAPVGTPVRTIGDGTVVKKGYQAGGAGYYLKVRHNSSYETTYMHLSKFAAGIAEGKRVSQGQVIGFVGSTGSSTGPHLDFRVHLNGKAINPLKMQSPPSLPVRPENRERFTAVRDSIINELNQLSVNTQ